MDYLLYVKYFKGFFLFIYFNIPSYQKLKYYLHIVSEEAKHDND